MPKFRYTIEAVGHTTTDIMPRTRSTLIYETGEWKPAKENWDSYDMTEIVEVSLKDDIVASAKAGAKFVIIADNAVHGHGSTPEEAWANALREHTADDLEEAQCRDIGGTKINDWNTRA